MDDPKEGLSIHKCLMGRLIESQMTWAGHVERMNEYPYQGWHKLTGRRRRRGPCLR